MLYILPKIDECKILILKIIEQAIRDYLSLTNATAPIEKYYYETATNLIFNDEYTIDYGGTDKTLEDLLDIVNLDIDWLRYKIIRMKEKRIKEINLKELISE